VALTTYIDRTRRLLHDSKAAFYSDADLTDYVNQSRQQVCRDSACLRTLIPSTSVALAGMVANQEVYDYSTFTGSGVFATIGTRIVDIFGIDVYWGSTRIKLFQYPWTKFDTDLRYWQNYRGRPGAFSRFASGTQVYVGPVPDQAYAADWDVVTVDIDLVTNSTTDSIPLPYQMPVPYYAAYLAKFNEQSYGESEAFEMQYRKHILSSMATNSRRVIVNPYRR
jgi:hypothetical protein